MSERTSGTQVTRHGGKMKPLSLRFAKKIFAFTMQKKTFPDGRSSVGSNSNFPNIEIKSNFPNLLNLLNQPKMLEIQTMFGKVWLNYLQNQTSNLSNNWLLLQNRTSNLADFEKNKSRTCSTHHGRCCAPDILYTARFLS